MLLLQLQIHNFSCAWFTPQIIFIVAYIIIFISKYFHCLSVTLPYCIMKVSPLFRIRIMDKFILWTNGNIKHLTGTVKDKLYILVSVNTWPNYNSSWCRFSTTKLKTLSEIFTRYYLIIKLFPSYTFLLFSSNFNSEVVTSCLCFYFLLPNHTFVKYPLDW